MIFNPKRNLMILLCSLLMLTLAIIYGIHLLSQPIEMNFLVRTQAPSFIHWFGTDNLGQDLWTKCFQGMTISLQIGLISACLCGILALVLASIASCNKSIDFCVRTIIDMMLSLPHLLLLILVCFTIGGGKSGIILAIVFTHWPKLALILRAEILHIKTEDYIRIMPKLGRTGIYCWYHQYLPLLVPQWIVGILLMFPHAILHSSALSFLGFGLSASDPSLGVLLSESLRYLNIGAWWLAFFPGLILVAMMIIFDQLAKAIRKLWLRSS